MKLPFKFLIGPVLGMLALLIPARAAEQVSTPIEFRQTETTYNYSDMRGVPISQNVGNPPGSSGLQPTGNASTGIFTTPTAGQFRGMITFGAGLGLNRTDWQVVSNVTTLKNGSTPFSGTVAQDMKRPVGLSNGVTIMVVRKAQIGSAYVTRQISFAFGSVITPPITDEIGVLLSPQAAPNYWIPEPHSLNNHTNSGYYWSPHAGKVYAIQPGPLSITWVRSLPIPVAQSSTWVNVNGTENFRTNGANKFILFTQQYVVSGSAVKPPRKLYWTQDEFQNLGKPISVPTARVGTINIVYNSTFPKTVNPADAYVSVSKTSPADGNGAATLKELRTMWYEREGLYAYNAEGRVFVELLGDLRSDGKTYKQLGTEIVDVSKQAVPLDVTTELGEQVVPPEGRSLDELDPEPLIQLSGQPFGLQRNIPGTGRVQYYAIRETRNQNDYLIHWMETGEAGLKWPKVFGRYSFVWPNDVSKFSLYIRPAVANQEEAKKTAVQLYSENVPSIEYQDPLDLPRAKLTPEVQFYTFLDPTQPVHRTLLKFASGDNIAFERVFSWLEGNLRSTNFNSNPIVTNLTSWNGSTLVWADNLRAPRVVNQTVQVGQRILAPEGEIGSNPAEDEYLAGYINQSIGKSYHPIAYKDPFVVGFDSANKGAIIPVNAIPATNRLEVWWFRSSQTRAGLNLGNTSLGFLANSWPSVMGRYTIEWPTNPREIVLASKLGGTGLSPLEAAGTIYVQNNPGLIGYNPNEEHAIMSGGTPFATRDDLNITSGNNYSSHPFVLVDYTEADARPAIAVFKVLREKPSAGWVFDYIVPAGQIIQPPPPLTFLPKPVEGSGASARNFNSEPSDTSADLPVNWQNSMQNGPFSHYQRFTYLDRHNDFWVYRGLHSGLPALQVGTYNATTKQFAPLGSATAVVNQQFSFSVHASRQDENLSLSLIGAPGWLGADGLKLKGVPAPADVGSIIIQVVVRDVYEDRSITNNLSLSIASSGSPVTQGPLELISTNSYTSTQITFTNRPPFLGHSPDAGNSFTLRYYYKTLEGFAWPGFSNPPAPGSIVPYLRPFNSTLGQFVGDAGSKTTKSLDIVYRPIWPVRDPKDSSKPVPTLPYAATLAKPAFNLPGVRDFKTAELLYQQSIGTNIAKADASAVLHDATRAKYSDIQTHFADTGKIPAGIKTQSFEGKTYFPNLPPHLANRVFVDPTRGPKGNLALIGQFKEETLGESYLHLNVLRGSDLAAVLALCPTNDVQSYTKWTNLVSGLETSLEYFIEDSPGIFIAGPVKRGVGIQDLASIDSAEIAVDSYAISATGPGGGYVTLLESSGAAFTEPGDPVSMHIFKVGGTLSRGELKVIPSENPLSELLTIQHSADVAGRFGEFEYEWKIAAPVDGFPPLTDATMSRYLPLTPVGTNIPRYTLGGAGIQALSDNYVVMRFRPINPAHPLFKNSPTDADWSPWTQPALAEGWIKRVLAGINPFNQRVNDLFNNKVNTDVSIITQAGRRWEGDVALNLESINNYGLIEIYETVLRRGRSLSIESGFNYGPANDALLLAAGYLSDLYMMIGNEAWADAANPTIGIGTADKTYGDIATAMFSFRGQVPTLLEEELALLRGRDDFLLPGVEITPVYNRLIWNYTRGIDAGEVIYSLNYNIQENPDQSPDGVINAEDAARMFPQGHGDAYGHYLTALKGYYSLLINANFDWVPRIEAVNVLGKPVSVDYQDERKFASAAAAVARSGRQTFELTWRKDYQPVGQVGWEQFSETRQNTQRNYKQVADGSTSNPERNWGMDHWASRVMQGTFLNWVVGNAILPEIDPIPTHEGIQKVDRTTVPELLELVNLAKGLQTSLDNAEAGLSPLGIPEDGLAFDLNPNAVVGGENGTHFEQVFQRAKGTLNNAVAAFDDAKDVTRIMRSEQDSLLDFQSTVARQELAYTNALVELYGTPYSDDIGPGKTFPQGYEGPDLFHYMYVDDVTLYEARNGMWEPNTPDTFVIDIQALPTTWDTLLTTNNWAVQSASPSYKKGEHYIEYEWNDHGFLGKPSSWNGRRKSPGKIQQAISEIIAAHDNLYVAITAFAMSDKQDLDKAIQLHDSMLSSFASSRETESQIRALEGSKLGVDMAYDISSRVLQQLAAVGDDVAESVAASVPENAVFGVASGGDVAAPAVGGIILAGKIGKHIVMAIDTLAFIARTATITGLDGKLIDLMHTIDNYARTEELKRSIVDIGAAMKQVQGDFILINEALRRMDDAKRRYNTLVAEGDRIQAERMVFRQHAAAVVQGYRTRDAAFRIFRNEKLERYKTLFDLSARYALLAANAYDYETGLLNTQAGRNFKSRIISSRALGVVRSGEPQFAGSNTGDPGISSALAEMKADWDVLRGRLGFNNPDAYGTTVSLRTGKERILPGSEGDDTWKDVLNRARVDNILADPDVRRHCLQVDLGDGLPVPGIVLSFSTTISEGRNLFGQPLAAGDQAFSSSSFATKIFGVGVALEGYRGMSNPGANGSVLAATGGRTVDDPNAWYLDSDALSGTPYIYLIPVGNDSMRSPPLGDASGIRSWNVQDLAIPMPFNIGASDFSSKNLYQSADSLTEPLFSLRKHQAFRPVSTTELFSPALYTGNGSLKRSQFTNNRLVGRSVWNSQWKIVIPGRTLLGNPDEGLDRFLRTVKDIKLHFVTYSYSGN